VAGAIGRKDTAPEGPGRAIEGVDAPSAELSSAPSAESAHTSVADRPSTTRQNRPRRAVARISVHHRQRARDRRQSLNLWVRNLAPFLLIPAVIDAPIWLRFVFRNDGGERQSVALTPCCAPTRRSARHRSSARSSSDHTRDLRIVWCPELAPEVPSTVPGIGDPRGEASCGERVLPDVIYAPEIGPEETTQHT
jgi:hypothetical protein